MPVYGAPVGWGSDPTLPFGMHGKDVDKDKKYPYKGKWPPSKGEAWWRVSKWFRPDRGYEFYTKVLKAKLDILDYVEFNASLAR